MQFLRRHVFVLALAGVATGCGTARSQHSPEDAAPAEDLSAHGGPDVPSGPVDATARADRGPIGVPDTGSPPPDGRAAGAIPEAVQEILTRRCVVCHDASL